jgi:lipopolysaccharide/colanic/teichoic acid biosynthesis glycosyltransferase
MVLVFLGRVTALLLCVVLFPVHLMLTLLIRISDGGPALYHCHRVGSSGATFELRKYRTLHKNAYHLLSSGLRMVVKKSDPRITPFGKLLRCGIDELPQLWNIVKGEMAWVGPRPDPDWMLPHYGQTCRARLAALPGLTGFAQILNSRSLSTPEAFALDIWYIRHRTWVLDTLVVLATPFYIAGWHSLGQRRLHALRASLEFQELRSMCNEEIAGSEETLLASANLETMLPPNTVVC